MPRNVASRFVAALLLFGLSIPAIAADDGVKRDAKPSQLPSQNLQGMPLPFNIQLPPTRPKEEVVPNTVTPSISGSPSPFSSYSGVSSKSGCAVTANARMPAFGSKPTTAGSMVVGHT